MKSGWEKYASEKRYIKKGYLRKYCNGGKSGKACKASSSDCLQQSREKQEEEINPGLSLNLQEIVEKEIEWYGKTVLLTEDIIFNGENNESIGEKDVGKTHQERRQGIQESDQRRCEIKKENTCKIKGEKMKKQSLKERKHEAKETKAYERKEDRKERKSKKK